MRSSSANSFTVNGSVITVKVKSKCGYINWWISFKSLNTVKKFKRVVSFDISKCKHDATAIYDGDSRYRNSHNSFFFSFYPNNVRSRWYSSMPNPKRTVWFIQLAEYFGFTQFRNIICCINGIFTVRSQHFCGV